MINCFLDTEMIEFNIHSIQIKQASRGNLIALIFYQSMDITNSGTPEHNGEQSLGWFYKVHIVDENIKKLYKRIIKSYFKEEFKISPLIYISEIQIKTQLRKPHSCEVFIEYPPTLIKDIYKQDEIKFNKTIELNLVDNIMNHITSERGYV